MGDFQKIIIATFGILLVPRLLRGQSEEPSNFIDTPTGTVLPSPIGDPSLIPTFCNLNYAENAFTTHFSLSEFHSKDGTEVPKELRGHIKILMLQLEVIRAKVNEVLQMNAPMIMTSGYRSPQHNKAVGGVKNSMHVCGKAGDYYMQGVDNNTVQQITLDLIQSGQIIDGGLGRYNNFTHYDIGASRRWDKR